MNSSWLAFIIGFVLSAMFVQLMAAYLGHW